MHQNFIDHMNSKQKQQTEQIITHKKHTWTPWFKVETQCGWKPPAAICFYLPLISNFFYNVLMQSFTSTQASTCRRLQPSLSSSRYNVSSIFRLDTLKHNTPIWRPRFIKFSYWTHQYHWTSQTLSNINTQYLNLVNKDSHQNTEQNTELCNNIQNQLYHQKPQLKWYTLLQFNKPAYVHNYAEGNPRIQNMLLLYLIFLMMIVGQWCRIQ